MAFVLQFKLHSKGKLALWQWSVLTSSSGQWNAAALVVRNHSWPLHSRTGLYAGWYPVI